MQLSSVLRRYTPPTCSLEVATRSSRLSRWTGQSGANLWFKLNLDDPRLPEEKRVTIQGDRAQLEVLHEAVTTYAQNLISQTPEQFNAVFAASSHLSSDSVESYTPDILNPSANDSQASPETPPALESDSFPASSASNLEPSSQNELITPSPGIFLEPSQGLSHNLFLGSLANPETGRYIQLSVLQLFDLVTALDEYAHDAVVPSLNRFSASTVPTWTTIAAVLVATVGLAAVGVQIFHNPQQQQTALTNPNQPATINNSDQNSLQPLPVPTLASPGMPPIPPPGSVSQSPNFPPVTIPKTDSIPVTPQATTAPRLNPSPAPGATVPSTVPPIVINPVPRQNQPVLIPGQTPSKTSNTRTPTSSAPPVATSNSNFQVSAPKPNLETAISRASRETRVPTNAIPATEPNPNAATQTPSGSNPTTSNQSTQTAFDSIPQIAEARQYFQQRWQPPTGLAETLEYSIVLDADGTIQRIEPLGQAARTYVDRSGMPLIGERFVSPISNGKSPRIRVVLNPNGQVQTFLE